MGATTTGFCMPAIVVNVYLYDVGIHTIYLTGRGEFDWDIFV